ncbi:hypothetical protein [Mycolicibacterium arenosum]|uniref:Uncharacterized protein n=1 Tax=Mycolicibacterium arenosum TaxID=2952157 RepID=A0ABT1MBD6_9MYCO|nr:hypothetical protein [Mycolicibacterium sp. CAU 1645]MCP9276484.1 hypothetical protein [Mycolicibacterium sp. CAU 1645]
MAENPIKIEAPAFGRTAAQWFAEAPTSPGAPPVSAVAVPNPLDESVLAVLAEWPAVHESLVADRLAKATAFTTANGGTTAILTAEDAANAADISAIEV